MQRTRQGDNVATAQDLARARQQHRRALRQKLSELITEADAAYREQRWADFEELRAGIRIVLADLGASNRHMSPKRVAERLPVSPSTRRRGAGE